MINTAFVSQCITILNTYDSSTAPLFESASLAYLYHKIRHKMLLKIFEPQAIAGVTQQRHFRACFLLGCIATPNAPYHKRASSLGINLRSFLLSPSCNSHLSTISPTTALGPYLNHVSTSFKPTNKPRK